VRVEERREVGRDRDDVAPATVRARGERAGDDRANDLRRDVGLVHPKVPSSAGTNASQLLREEGDGRGANR
jgi:hypothetical protein